MAKKVNTSDVQISEALKATVLGNPNIKEVHFRKDGKHVFHAYEHNKVLYGQVNSTRIMEKGGVMRDVKTPVLSSEIETTLTREQILGTSDR